MGCNVRGNKFHQFHGSNGKEKNHTPTIPFLFSIEVIRLHVHISLLRWCSEGIFCYASVVKQERAMLATWFMITVLLRYLKVKFIFSFFLCACSDPFWQINSLKIRTLEVDRKSVNITVKKALKNKLNDFFLFFIVGGNLRIHYSTCYDKNKNGKKWKSFKRRCIIKTIYHMVVIETVPLFHFSLSSLSTKRVHHNNLL